MVMTTRALPVSAQSRIHQRRLWLDCYHCCCFSPQVSVTHSNLARQQGVSYDGMAQRAVSTTFSQQQLRSRLSAEFSATNNVALAALSQVQRHQLAWTRARRARSTPCSRRMHEAQSFRPTVDCYTATAVRTSVLPHANRLGQQPAWTRARRA